MFPIAQVLRIRQRDQLFREGKLDSSRIYTCPHCDKQFCRSDRYKNHLATHTKVFKFLCDECPYAASTKADLTYHKDKHEVKKGERSALVCQYCGSTKNHKNAMNLHLQQAHPVEYALAKDGCDGCQEGFEDAETLKNHMLKEVKICFISTLFFVLNLFFII